ncbi:MAG: 50S ribosomal protein L10 [Chthoniobacterales bacterium]
MRPEKANIVADVRNKLNESPFLLVVDYSGMKVDHFAEFRNRLSASGAECHVVKNTMLRIAIKELELPELTDALGGQNAMITGPSDICAAAKAVKNFHKEFEKPVLRAGILDNDLLSIDQVNALADLPSKEILQATFLGLLTTPATRLVRVLNEPGASLARLLKAKAEKDGGAA